MPRTIAVTQLIDGQVLIGEMVTISTIIGQYPPRQTYYPRRTTYRGLVFDIRTWEDGCDYASIAVTGMAEPILVRLEPITSYAIHVNSREEVVHSPTLSYEDVVRLSGESPVVLQTVVYHHAAKGRSDGTLTPGKSIEIQDGTRFEVCFTGNA